MANKRIADSIDPSKSMPLEQWLDQVEDIAEDHGYFEPLGPDHSATFLKGSDTLLVTFETIQSVRDRANHDTPIGWQIAARNGWSQLCILSHGETWFRHRAVYSFFDRLIDEGTFDEYENVVFYGDQSCGYAAAAYSVAAPGSVVLALSPQASLDPRVCEWDDRFHHMRRTSFTDRYGYAPDMLEAAQACFVLYDPETEADAMHAALFSGTNITRVRCRHLGCEIETFLRRMDVLEPILKKAAKGKLRAFDIYAALRERRNYLPYLRNFLNAVQNTDRPFLTGLMCRSVLSRINTPRFRQQLTVSQNALRAEGRRLPNAAPLELV